MTHRSTDHLAYLAYCFLYSDHTVCDKSQTSQVVQFSVWSTVATHQLDISDTWQVSVTEDRTREEKSEEQALVAEVMRTEVMRKTLAFLKAHGLFTKSPAEFARLLEELWFSVYRWGAQGFRR